MCTKQRPTEAEQSEEQVHTSTGGAGRDRRHRRRRCGAGGRCDIEHDGAEGVDEDRPPGVGHGFGQDVDYHHVELHGDTGRHGGWVAGQATLPGDGRLRQPSRGERRSGRELQPARLSRWIARRGAATPRRATCRRRSESRRRAEEFRCPRRTVQDVELQRDSQIVADVEVSTSAKVRRGETASTHRDRDVHDEKCDARGGIGLKSASPWTISENTDEPVGGRHGGLELFKRRIPAGKHRPPPDPPDLDRSGACVASAGPGRGDASGRLPDRLRAERCALSCSGSIPRCCSIRH